MTFQEFLDMVREFQDRNSTELDGGSVLITMLTDGSGGVGDTEGNRLFSFDSPWQMEIVLKHANIDRAKALGWGA